MIAHIEQEIESSEEQVVSSKNHLQNIEINIKTSRVMVAIEQTIQKLEIAFCLPWILVENMNDLNVVCGEKSMSKLTDEYCKLRDGEDMDVCRFQPTVINCINDAFQAGLSKFVGYHLSKVIRWWLELLDLSQTITETTEMIAKAFRDRSKVSDINGGIQMHGRMANGNVSHQGYE